MKNNAALTKKTRRNKAKGTNRATKLGHPHRQANGGGADMKKQGKAGNDGKEGCAVVAAKQKHQKKNKATNRWEAKPSCVKRGTGDFKVVVRRLPPALDESRFERGLHAFLNRVLPLAPHTLTPAAEAVAEAPRGRLLYFAAGKQSRRRGAVPSTAYIAFQTAAAAGTVCELLPAETRFFMECLDLSSRSSAATGEEGTMMAAPQEVADTLPTLRGCIDEGDTGEEGDPPPQQPKFLEPIWGLELWLGELGIEAAHSPHERTFDEEAITGKEITQAGEGIDDDTDYLAFVKVLHASADQKHVGKVKPAAIYDGVSDAATDSGVSPNAGPGGAKDANGGGVGGTPKSHLGVWASSGPESAAKKLSRQQVAQMGSSDVPAGSLAASTMASLAASAQQAVTAAVAADKEANPSRTPMVAYFIEKVAAMKENALLAKKTDALRRHSAAASQTAAQKAALLRQKQQQTQMQRQQQLLQGGSSVRGGKPKPLPLARQPQQPHGRGGRKAAGAPPGLVKESSDSRSTMGGDLGWPGNGSNGVRTALKGGAFSKRQAQPPQQAPSGKPRPPQQQQQQQLGGGVRLTAGMLRLPENTAKGGSVPGSKRGGGGGKTLGGGGGSALGGSYSGSSGVGGSKKSNTAKGGSGGAIAGNSSKKANKNGGGDGGNNRGDHGGDCGYGGK